MICCSLYRKHYSLEIRGHTYWELWVQNIVNRWINKHFDCIVCRQRQSDQHNSYTDQRQTIQRSHAPFVLIVIRVLGPNVVSRWKSYTYLLGDNTARCLLKSWHFNLRYLFTHVRSLSKYFIYLSREKHIWSAENFIEKFTLTLKIWRYKNLPKCKA